MFCLSLQQEGKAQEIPKQGSLINKLRFSCSSCYIARDTYWEHIAHYPTTNLLEVYKIVQAEIPHIAPIAGQTYAYLINSANNSTTVLYCCFNNKTIASAKSLKLWRLLPETLPYYRYLYGKVGVYLSKLELTLVNSDEIKQPSATDEKAICSELLIKSDAEHGSSLPVDRANLDMYCIAMLDEAIIIDEHETKAIFNKLNYLTVIDFAAQAIEGLSGLVNKKGYLARYLATVGIAFLLTFILGKSAFITWHNDYLIEKVAESKNAAVDSLKLSNQLKNIKIKINNINASLTLQVPKAQLLIVLSSLINQENNLEFYLVDISPAEMQLRGTSSNSANLLTTLSNIKGFNQVEFYAPPVALKEGGERFFITLRFDESIKQYQEKDKELTQ